VEDPLAWKKKIKPNKRKSNEKQDQGEGVELSERCDPIEHPVSHRRSISIQSSPCMDLICTPVALLQSGDTLSELCIHCVSVPRWLAGHLPFSQTVHQPDANFASCQV
jgi:hypothetical protein